MILRKANKNDSGDFFMVDVNNTGCCPVDVTACQYRFLFATLPATFTSITVTLPEGSTVLSFVHTYTTARALQLAIYDLLTKGVTEGGAGLSMEANDLLVYMDTFAVGGSKLAIEFNNSAYDFTAIAANVVPARVAKCNTEVMCVYRFEYTEPDAIAVNINGLDLTLTTYATSALLRTALLAQIAAVVPGLATVRVRDKTATVDDVWFYVKVGVPLYINGKLQSQSTCGKIYIS